MMYRLKDNNLIGIKILLNLIQTELTSILIGFARPYYKATDYLFTSIWICI